MLSVGLSLSAGNVGGAVLSVIVLAIPPMAFVTLALWLIEMARMMRAGNYLRMLENRLNRELGSTGLIWENWLRSQVSSGVFDPHTVHYWAQRISTFLIVVIASLAIWMIAISQQTLLLDKWVFVGVYSAFAALLVLFAWPIVVHSRRGPTAYALGDTEAYREFQRWLKTYGASLEHQG